MTVTRTPTTCSIDRTVEWVDTDAGGHQHNSVLLRWAESCEAELFRGLGLPEYFPRAPRVQQSVNFTARLWFGQRVTTTVTLEKIGRTSMAFRFDAYAHAFEGREASPAAHGTFVTVYITPGQDQAGPWPKHFLDRLTAATT